MPHGQGGVHRCARFLSGVSSRLSRAVIAQEKMTVAGCGSVLLQPCLFDGLYVAVGIWRSGSASPLHLSRTGEGREFDPRNLQSNFFFFTFCVQHVPAHGTARPAPNAAQPQ